MKIFITGGAGFIGTALAKKLIKHEVVIYDNFSRPFADHLIWYPQCIRYVGDVLDYDLLKESIHPDTDLVIHMAAIAGIDTVIKNPVKTMEVNMIGTYHLLKALKELKLIEKLKGFINLSTSEVFGINAFRSDEKSSTNFQPVGEARWTYSVSKLAGEYLVHSYYKQAINVRPFNIYGPGQVGEGAIHSFVINAIKNEPLIIQGEGDQIRSWCYIDDMVDGLLLCLEKKEAIGEIFNIGNPRGTITILGLAEKIIQLAGSSSEIFHVPKTYVDVDFRMPNIKKAKMLLGFEPKIDLNEGIARTIEWYRSKET